MRELTPWIPVLSTSTQLLAISPVHGCEGAFEAKYERSSTANCITPSTEFVEKLNLGGDGVYVSAYSMYSIWLGVSQSTLRLGD